MNRVSLIVLLLIVACSILLYSCMKSDNKKGGVFIYGRGSDCRTLDPAKVEENESAIITNEIYEGLVRYKIKSTEVEPCLAVSWLVSDDNKEWIFKLRKGVTFHDGTPFNASAVVFSIQRQIDSDHPYYQKNWPYADFTFKYVTKVEEVDDYTVRIILSNSFAPFLSNLAMDAANIVSPSAVKKWGDKFELNPVGTGPFRFDQWVKNDRVIISRNNQYWGKTPNLDKVIVKVISNNKDRLLALQTGSIHAMEITDPENINLINKHSELNTIRKPSLIVAYLALNNEKKPFNQKKVRQAINYAINKENLIKLYYYGKGIAAKNPIPPGMWGYNDKIKDYEYNPEKAKKLLEEAGYGNGFKATFWYKPVTKTYIPYPKEIATAIRSNLQAVGIETKEVSDDWKSKISRIKNGEHDIYMSGWFGDNGDPDNFIYTLLDQDNAVKPIVKNYAFFRNKKCHDLLIEAQQVLDKQKRSDLYKQAQEIIHEEAPWVPLAYVNAYYAYRNNMKNFEVNSVNVVQFRKIWIE